LHTSIFIIYNRFIDDKSGEQTLFLAFDLRRNFVA